jgi:hypothetical protein
MTRFRAGALAAVCVVALAGTACNSKDKGSSTTTRATTTSTSSADGSTTSAPADGPSTTAASNALPGTPEATAQVLYTAWKEGDRVTASRVASDEAVDELFSHPYTGPDLTFQGCDPTPTGADCFWSYEGGGMTMRVLKQSGEYKVNAIEYVAD